ncbi:hypothetical protein FGB62_123g05 [Gracilaria domingensis]|nr:hypothetical protein FGB62_123g05 [Gracilaria domingensis]
MAISKCFIAFTFVIACCVVSAADVDGKNGALRTIRASDMKSRLNSEGRVCESNGDCKRLFGDHCECVGFDDESRTDCYDPLVFQSENSRCAKCESSADCTGGDDDTCDSNLEVCASCTIDAVQAAIKSCFENASPLTVQSDTESETVTETGAPDETETAAESEMQTDAETQDATEMQDSTETPTGTGTKSEGESQTGGEGESGAGTKSETKGSSKCVETEWLKENGFANGILREYGVAKTVCISGLPCGTEGHLLRACKAGNQCNLVTYKQVCESRGDCEVKYTSVSRISHRVDWSSVQAEDCGADGGRLSLTSVSVDVEGAYTWPSYVIARVGDAAIWWGLGGALDLVVLTCSDLVSHAAHVAAAMTALAAK